MNDEKIIELYWDRDQEAIAQTDIKYGGLCRNISLNILSDRQDSEECVSDTYMAAWNSMPPQRPAYLRGYIAAIVRNISLMRLRSRYSKKNGGGSRDLVLEELEDSLCSEFSLEREYEQRELVDAINRFLYTLSGDDRKIFMCRYWLFAPVADIAGRLDCSKSRMTTSLYRKRQKLRKFLNEEGLL